MEGNLRPHSHSEGEPTFSGWQPTPIPAPAANPKGGRAKTWQYVLLGFVATSVVLACVVASFSILNSGDDEPAEAAAPAVNTESAEAPATTAAPPTTVPPATTTPESDDEPDQPAAQEPPTARAVTALNTASLNLAKLQARSEHPAPTSTFSADDYPRWLDADGDCQDTRTELLIQSSATPVLYDSTECGVLSGTWTDRYSGQTLLTANDVSIDHVVPLAEAHLGGGAEWDAQTRQAFANDLTNTAALGITTLDGNAQKGDQTPDAWMPDSDAAACRYAIDWIDVKSYWELSVTDDERDALHDGLGRCTTQALRDLDSLRSLEDA